MPPVHSLPSDITQTPNFVMPRSPCTSEVTLTTRWSDLMEDDDDFAGMMKHESDSVRSLDTAEPCSSTVTEVASTTDSSSDTESSCPRTTVLISGLAPNCSRCGLWDLLASMDVHQDCDFLYVPVQFKQPHAGNGFGFANFSSEDAAQEARHRLEQRGFQVVFSEHQGIEAHIERFRNSPVMHPSVPDEARPALYRDGLRVAFPVATRKIKAPRGKRS